MLKKLEKMCSKNENYKPCTFGSTISSIPGASRTHYFKIIFILKPRICIPCGKQLRFSKKGLKCQDCEAICHTRCHEKLPVPCVPIPKFKFKDIRGIADLIYVKNPAINLMVPPIIQQIVNELDKRLQKAPIHGLYLFERNSIYAKEIFYFYKNGKIPNFSQYDSQILAKCLLNSISPGVLPEPLVPPWYFENLVYVTEIPDLSEQENVLQEIISSWPRPNCETLAFLILHLKRINTNKLNGTSKKSLAWKFAPHLLRKSNSQSQKIVETFLKYPKRFWLQFFCNLNESY